MTSQAEPQLSGFQTSTKSTKLHSQRSRLRCLLKQAPKRFVILLMGFLILSGPLATHAEVFAVFLQSVGRPASSSQRDVRALEPGKPVEADLDAGQSHHYSLALESGQYTRLIVQADKDVMALLVAPSGKRLLREDSRYFPRRVLTLPWVSEESGSYQLEVRSPDEEMAPGRYTVVIEELRAATDRDKKRLAAALTFGEGTRLRGHAGGGGQSTAESLRKSIEKYQEALQLFRDLGDRTSEAHTAANIASVYDALDENQLAHVFYTQAVTLYRADGHRLGESRSLYGLASIYRRSGEYQKAIEYFNGALSILRTLGDRRNEAFTIMSIGQLHVLLGENQKSHGFYNQALSMFRATGDRSGEANLLNAIGSFHLSQNESEKALDFYNQGLGIYRAIGDRRGEAESLTGLGRGYTSLNQDQKARELYNQALQLYVSAGSRRGEAYTHLFLGRSYFSLGEQQKSLDHLNRALALSRAMKERGTEGVALYDIARVQRNIGNLIDARSHIEAAIRIAESLRHEVPGPELRASFFASVQDYYQLETCLLMELHKQRPSEGFDSAALEMSERARARSLLDLFAEARADIRQGVDAALLERERSLGQLLNARAERQTQLLSGKHNPEQATALAKEIDSLLTDYQQGQAQIRASSPRYAALTQPKPLSRKEIQQIVGANTLLLEYSLGEERSYLWAVSSDSISSYELPNRAEIESVARRFYELAKTDSQAAQMAEAASKLSEILLAPVADRLRSNRLVVVADGILHYVPFAALPRPVASRQWSVVSGLSSVKGQRATERPPLIVEHEIVTLPSASVLAEMRRDLAGRKAAAKAVAVFADPVFTSDDPRVNSTVEKSQPPADTRSLSRDLERAMRDVGAEGFARLPFSRREAEAIATIAPARQALKALDFHASRSVAFSNDLSHYRIVHFATHGLLNSNHPELSGIVLSLIDREGQPQNGFLRSHELYNLKLPAELVVLSACQTGLGKEIRGEGLVGLTRGFMYAGAPRVVAGLWKVDDAATAELMKRFYKGMFARDLRPAAALREAQIEMWKQQRWRQPYYWAAFVLQGEWK